MRGVEGKAGKSRFGFSYALLALAVVTYLGVWAYSSYAAEWKAKAAAPRIDPVLKLIKDLRHYQKVKATFPSSLNELEGAIWKHPLRPNFGADGRSLVLSNYYYFYTWLSPIRCTLWAIPVGPQTDEANTYFLVLSPEDREKWKGPALELKEAATVSGTPTYAQLGILGMVKQDPPLQKRR
ncbi:MAG: hypothetical protein ABR568_20010 [Pyrinomonadaceae bacterium]